MKIQSNEELQMFERVIDTCRSAVLLVTPDGMQYNLKTPMERYQGIGKLIHGRDMVEPEIYTSCFEDEMNLFGFIIDCLHSKDTTSS